MLLSSVSLPGDKYDASIISDLMESIDKYYYFQDEKPDVDTMLKAAADAVIASTGDRYAEYFTDEGYDAYYDNLNGGVGTIPGILVGVLVFEVLKIVLQFLGVESSYTYIAQGLVIIIAVALDLRKYLAKK